MFRDVALAGETGGTHMVVKAHGKAVKQPPECHQWLVYVRRSDELIYTTLYYRDQKL